MLVPSRTLFFCSVADFQHSVAGGYFFRYMLLFSMQAHYSPETQHEQFSFILHPYRRIFTFAHGDYFYCRTGNRFFSGNLISDEADDSFKGDVITLRKISLHQL